MKNRITHFEIQADDIERAKKFYEDVFGWEIAQWGEQKYWMIMSAERGSTEPGINGGLLPRNSGTPVDGLPVNAYVCTVQVGDIDDIIKRAEAAGARVALPKFAFPGMAWQAYYKDTEGNIFGIQQADPNAK